MQQSYTCSNKHAFLRSSFLRAAVHGSTMRCRQLVSVLFVGQLLLGAVQSALLDLSVSKGFPSPFLSLCSLFLSSFTLPSSLRSPLPTLSLLSSSLSPCFEQCFLEDVRISQAKEKEGKETDRMGKKEKRQRGRGRRGEGRGERERERNYNEEVRYDGCSLAVLVGSEGGERVCVCEGNGQRGRNASQEQQRQKEDELICACACACACVCVMPSYFLHLTHLKMEIGRWV